MSGESLSPAMAGRRTERRGFEKVKRIACEFWWCIRWSSRVTAVFHVLAMTAPINSWRLFFYRLRGTRIGSQVYIVQNAFIEESRPWLVEIGDRVRIGAGAIIVAHDAIYHGYDGSIPYRYDKVVLKRGASICPGAIILPGVVVGENAVVAPGALVRHNVADGVIVAGNPAQQIMTVEEGLTKCRKKIQEYMFVDNLTKYPWNKI